jgi:probable HAF family extracellular repeat protein
VRALCLPLFLLLCANAFPQTTLNCNLLPLPLAGDFNIAYGINDASQIVGDIILGDGAPEGFLFSGNHAKFFSVSGATQTLPADINNPGQIVGTYTDAQQVNHGFLHDATGFHTIDYPGQTENPSTGVSGINDQGTIVGGFGIFFGAGSSSQGFVLQNGQFTVIAFPGAVITGANGINNQGEIVGDYAILDSGNVPIFHGFYWNEGQFTTVDYPGATSTSLNGINDSGIATGIYDDAIGNPHPFAFKNGQFFAFSLPTTDRIQIYGLNNKNQIVGLDIGPQGSIKSTRVYCRNL